MRASRWLIPALTLASCAPSAVQNCPLAQSTSAAQSTHTPPPHTWSSALHCRDEVHGVGAATQALPRQTEPMAQSTSARHSTQRPAAVSQTWPAQVRDVTHATGATQRWALHTGVAPPQS